MMKVGEAIYKAQQANAATEGDVDAPQEAASAEDAAAEGEVLDAEFEEIDDEKK